MAGKKVSRKERISYGLYFLGQNIIYMLLYMFLTTYFTDVGISAVAVAGIALVVKVWDAVNDPILGGIIDKVKFKNGKFVPWLRVSLVGIPIATILLFAIPNTISPVLKVVWAVVAYLLWSVFYTLCDVPIYGLITVITDVQEERTSLNATGRVCATIAMIILMAVIPSFRTAMGGWTSTVVILSVIAFITMFPICVTAKERVTAAKDNEKSDVSMRDMFRYLKGNKYLLIYYLGFLFVMSANVTSVWGLYICRFCLGDESVQTVSGILSFAPVIVLGMLVPTLCKKIDKFKLYYISVALYAVACVIKYFMGCSSIGIYILSSIIVSLPFGMIQLMMYMFTPDCAEYGQYKSGMNLPGITFSTQTFFAKLQSALVTVFSSLILAAIGFVSGEGARQAEGFADKLWTASCVLPLAGAVLGLIILRFYKLNDYDVQIMAKCNAGEITREEAEKQMKNKY